MKFAKSLSSLIQSAIELPNALHACIEMARESTAYAREQSPGKRALADMSMMEAANEKKIEELTKKLFSAETERESLRSDLKYREESFDALGQEYTKSLAKLAAQESELSKLHEVESELNRERESRRHRQVKRGEGELPPPNVSVLYQWNHPKAAATPPAIGRMGQPGTYWWRYLSPEDIPQ